MPQRHSFGSVVIYETLIYDELSIIFNFQLPPSSHHVNHLSDKILPNEAAALVFTHSQQDLTDESWPLFFSLVCCVLVVLITPHQEENPLLQHFSLKKQSHSEMSFGIKV